MAQVYEWAVMKPVLEILIAISCLGQFTTGDIPASLVKAFQQREDFRSSRLRYEVEREFPGYQARKMSRYEVLTAANDIAWTNFGDADGIVERDIPTGMPRFGLAFACAPYQIIRGHSTGVEWNQTKGYSVISRSKPNRFLSEEIDPRNIGLYPLSQRDRLPSELLHQLFETPGQWSEAAAGDLIEVRMMCQPNSDEDPTYGVLIWKIDPTKDFTLIECRKEIVESDGNRYVS